MNLITKFGLNDKVVGITRDCVSKWVSCPACNGTGVFSGANKKEYRCSECYGQKGKPVYGPVAWIISRTLTIGEVKAAIKNITPNGMFCNIGHYEEGKDQMETEYMAYETGIGSGRIYHERDLFSTVEEAQEECNKRNQEEGLTLPITFEKEGE